MENMAQGGAQEGEKGVWGGNSGQKEMLPILVTLAETSKQR